MMNTIFSLEDDSMTRTANDSTETILKSLIALLAIVLMLKVMTGGFF